MSARNNILFSILNYLSGINKEKPEGVDTESLEVAIQCLQQAFNISFEDEEQKKQFLPAQPLETIFKMGLGAGKLLNFMPKAVAAKKPTEEEKFELKFKEYLRTLEEKGFFQGAEEGTEEYTNRVEKARARLKEHEAKEREVNNEKAEQKKTEGNILLQQKRYDEAISCYDAAISLNPTCAIYYANRAAAYSTLRRHDKAIEDCTSAIEIDPTYSKAYSRLGLAHFSLSQYKQAAEAYRKAKELDPDNATIIQSLAIAEKKVAEKGEHAHAHGDHGHSHGDHGHSHGDGGSCGHSHEGAQTFTPPAGMPDLAGLMNNPAIQNMVSGFQNQAGGAAPGGMPDVSSLLSNPEMMQTAAQLLNAPGMGNILNNPSIMNMASQIMSNPDMLNSMMSSFGGMGGKKPE